MTELRKIGEAPKTAPVQKDGHLADERDLPLSHGFEEAARKAGRMEYNTGSGEIDTGSKNISVSPTPINTEVGVKSTFSRGGSPIADMSSVDGDCLCQIGSQTMKVSIAQKLGFLAYDKASGQYFAPAEGRPNSPEAIAIENELRSIEEMAEENVVEVNFIGSANGQTLSTMRQRAPGVEACFTKVISAVVEDPDSAGNAIDELTERVGATSTTEVTRFVNQTITNALEGIRQYAQARHGITLPPADQFVEDVTGRWSKGRVKSVLTAAILYNDLRSVDQAIAMWQAKDRDGGRHKFSGRGR